MNTVPSLAASALVAALALGACSTTTTGVPGPTVSGAPAAPSPGPLVRVPVPDNGAPLVFIAYGDMRFTSTAEVEASRPGPRQALVARIAIEHPAALFLNGDVPWHGGTVNDYQVFADETVAWRSGGIAVFPALGNHEFSQCSEADCLENWWQAFPALRGVRWYSIALGSRVFAVNLDSDASLLPGSPQRLWLESQLGSLPRRVEFVLISLHHPPVADEQTGKLADHNARRNEQALASYLEGVAATSSARFIVSAGHIHNYERQERGGVVYLVSGGGGARPYPVERTPADLYQDKDFPNFHYVRFELSGDVLKAQMIRLSNPDADPARAEWQTKDQFTLTARTR